MYYILFWTRQNLKMTGKLEIWIIWNYEFGKFQKNWKYGIDEIEKYKENLENIKGVNKNKKENISNIRKILKK